MCKFNFILLKNPFSDRKNEEILKANGFGYREIKNKIILELTSEFDAVITTTKNNCDCNSKLGINEILDAQILEIEKYLISLKERKISESSKNKIVSRALSRISRIEQEKKLDLSNELQRWVNVIKKLTKLNTAVGIFHHDFNGTVLAEDFVIDKTKRANIQQFSVENLRNLKERELITITK